MASYRYSKTAIILITLAVITSPVWGPFYLIYLGCNKLNDKCCIPDK